jgi:hypothetical protein
MNAKRHCATQEPSVRYSQWVGLRPGIFRNFLDYAHEDHVEVVHVVDRTPHDLAEGLSRSNEMLHS